ncbi:MULTISPECIES: strawberry notch-like NTP hydrolase domain-containing protein [unclassified Xanthobacter]|uniref:strawberry notch-like NTP hydrolase domain-containing protein n=1 Tax=unclassified Xanthobacter TaxID=2623496 RepID=UPI001F3E77DC|nr:MULTISPECIES: strawberry notch family protein [unclassified Xanthobacter]
MASVLLPNLKSHGVAATFLTSEGKDLPAPALATFISENAPFSVDTFAEVVGKLDMPVLRALQVESRKAKGMLLLCSPKEKLDTRALWTALGLAPRGLSRVTVSQQDLVNHRLTFTRQLGVRKTVFDPIEIGRTRYGCLVRETPLGRIAEHSDGRVFRDWERGPDGKPRGHVRDFFLRATTSDELAGCARGAVHWMSLDRWRFNSSSFEKLYNHIVAADLRTAAGMTFADWHEHVEAECARAVSRSLSIGANPRIVAEGLNARLPDRKARSLENARFDQFSTPLTVSGAAALVLHPSTGETVLEPMVGNGVFVSVLAAQGAQITGVEIDPARARRATAALGEAAEIFTGSFEAFAAGPGKGREFDMLVMNPPFSTQVDAPSVAVDAFGRELRIARPDHYYIFEALKQLRADGRAFVVMAGDNVAEGRLEGARKTFDAWMRSMYDIAGAAVLDGAMYRKMGTQFNVQLYAIGPRRTEPLSVDEAVELAPREIPVLRNLDELNAWSAQAAANMRALLVARNPSIGAAADAAVVDGRSALGTDGASVGPNWSDAAKAANPAEAFGALVASRPLLLADASMIRIEDTRRGWTVVRRDPGGVATRHSNPSPSGAEWTRDQAIQAGLQMWGKEEQAAALAAVSGRARDASAVAQAGKPVLAAPTGSQPGGDAPAARGRRPRPAAAGDTRGGVARPVSPSAGAVPVVETDAPTPAPTEAAEAAVVGAMPEPVPVETFREDDDPFLLIYEPLSKVGESSTRIQRSLAGPTMAALSAVARRYGDIDEMVAARLGLLRDTPEETVAALGERFSPEQTDALALSFAAIERGQGFLNSDSMGVGKGRFLAAHISKALLEDRPIIFFSERPDLFQDLVARDLCDVTGLGLRDLPKHIRPFIFNNAKEARIIDYSSVDENGQPKLLFGHDAAAAKLAREKGIPTSGAGRVNLVLCTYSQLGAQGGDWKAAAIANWMTRFEKAPALLIDESHRAAGDTSRCGELTQKLVAAATSHPAVSKGDRATVIYSSATPLKSLNNIRVYAPILPELGMGSEKLLDLVALSPLAMQEAISYEMARAGTTISREMDQSGVVREFINLVDLNPEKYEHLRQKMDAVSEFLAEMLEKSGEVKTKAEVINKAVKAQAQEAEARGQKVGRAECSSVSPATRFHTIAQYMLSAFSCQFASELALRAVADGRKPVLVVDNVGDAMVQYMLGDGSGNLEVDDDAAEDTPVEGKGLDRLPNVGDMLIRNAEAMLDITIRNGFGVVEKRHLHEHDGWLEDFKARVRTADFSDLTTSGLDLIRQQLHGYGLSMAELTRRKFCMVPTDEGAYEVQARDKPRVQDITRDFNAGAIDVLAMNRSASSGISLQASPKNGGDLRPRKMIKLQLQADITHERQLDGRIHRTGQIVAGEYCLPMTGFVAQDRLCAMYNRKNRSLSSASRATRDSSTDLSNAPDILNPIGDRVVFNFLTANPVLAERFDIDVGGDGSSGSARGWEGMARKFMGRLLILPSQAQIQIMAEIESSFRLMVAELEAKGENPLKLSRYEWGAEVRELRQLIAGDRRSDSLAEKPLVLNQITYRETVRAASFQQVMERVERTRERWSQESGRYVGLDEQFPELEAIRNGDIDFQASLFDRVLNRDEGLGSLGLEAVSSKVAQEIWNRRGSLDKPSSLERNIVEAAHKARYLANIVQDIEPGRFVGVQPDLVQQVREVGIFGAWADMHMSDLTLVPAVVQTVRFPTDRPLNLGEWEIDFAVPGEEHALTISLASIYAASRAQEEEQEKARKTGAMPPTPPVWGPRPLLPAGVLLVAMAEGLSHEHAALLKSLKEGSADVEAGTFNPDVQRQLMEGCFRHAPQGERTRTRFSLEGNIFEAVAVAVQQKLGEKVLYTTDDGEIRHAVLLKNSKLDKLNASLEQSLAARTAPAPDNPALLLYVCSVLRSMEEISQTMRSRAQSTRGMADLTRRYGEQSSFVQREKERLQTIEAKLSVQHAALVGAVSQVSLALVDPLHADELRDLLLNVDDRTPGWIERLRLAIVEAGKAPAAVSVGSDPFQAAPDAPVEYRKASDSSLDVGVFSSRLQTLTKQMAGDREGAVVVPFNGLICVLTHAKGGLPEAADAINWRSSIAGVKPRAGCVIGQIADQKGMEELVEHARAHQRSLSFHGPLRAIFEEVRTITREMERELVEHTTLKMEDEKDMAPAPVQGTYAAP